MERSIANVQTKTRKERLINKSMMYLIFIAAILPVQAQDKDSSAHGLPWVFFNATDFSRPDNDVGVDAQVNLDTGNTFNDYSRFWSGYLKAPASGEITIVAEADNGLRLALNKKLVINGWEEGSAREGKVTVKEGEYLPLQLEFIQDGGTASLRLYWKWEGHTRELIPSSAFFHDQKDKDLIERLRACQKSQK